jgi:hypothetical protein
MNTRSFSGIWQPGKIKKTAFLLNLALSPATRFHHIERATLKFCPIFNLEMPDSKKRYPSFITKIQR